MQSAFTFLQVYFRFLFLPLLIYLKWRKGFPEISQYCRRSGNLSISDWGDLNLLSLKKESEEQGAQEGEEKLEELKGRAVPQNKLKKEISRIRRLD